MSVHTDKTVRACTLPNHQRANLAQIPCVNRLPTDKSVVRIVHCLQATCLINSSNPLALVDRGESTAVIRYDECECENSSNISDFPCFVSVNLHENLA